MGWHRETRNSLPFSGWDLRKTTEKFRGRYDWRECAKVQCWRAMTFLLVDCFTQTCQCAPSQFQNLGYATGSTSKVFGARPLILAFVRLWCNANIWFVIFLLFYISLCLCTLCKPITLQEESLELKMWWTFVRLPVFDFFPKQWEC